MRIITLPNNSELDPLPYSEVVGLGADLYNYYIFRTEFGGYMIPKSSSAIRAMSFNALSRKKTGKLFVSKRSRFVRLREWMHRRDNEPYHL